MGASMAPRLVALLHVAAVSAEKNRRIFSSSEVKHCESKFKNPSFVAGGGFVHVLATCAQSADAFSAAPNATHAPAFGDIVAEASCIMKSSSDNGVTWNNFQTLSPKGKKGYSMCKGIYDVKRHRLVVQYDYVPSGDSTDTSTKQFFQILSKDNGQSWSAPRELTDEISGCNNGDSKPKSTAGNRIQTSSGRLLWGGSSGGKACFWYSDDGGDSYHTQWANFKPNEFSLVETSDGRIYMNSRKGDECDENHRREYWSSDNGLTWTSPTCSSLLDSVNSHGHGCEASLTNIGGKLFFLNPAGQLKDARTHMQVHCSLDGGKSWPAKYKVSSTDEGGYSDLIYLPDKPKKKLMLGFMNNDNSNMWTVHIGKGWCATSDAMVV